MMICMRFISIAFVVILVLAHLAEAAATTQNGFAARPDALTLPLSMLRDGPAWFLGYLLFALLAGAGCLMVISFRQRNAVDDANVYIGGLCFLLFVAVTPSENVWHQGASFILLGLLYLYHAALLWHSRNRWFRIHLFVPLLVLVLTGAHSYGLWQKGLILYALAAMNMHLEYVRRRADRPTGKASLGARREERPLAVRVTLAPARGWGP
jgi:hypothetical protein